MVPVFPEGEEECLERWGRGACKFFEIKLLLKQRKMDTHLLPNTVTNETPVLLILYLMSYM